MAEIQETADETKAMLHLMEELNKGQHSGEEGGWVPEEDVRARFKKNHRKQA